MNLALFLDQLYDRGTVDVVPELTELPAEARFDSATQLLERFYHEDRLKRAGTMPPFDAASALAAAILLYRACYCLAQRKLSDDEVCHYLQAHIPTPLTAANVYSADLTLRYLADLLRLARGLAPEDVLIDQLQRIGARWPFSSVGIDHLPPLENLHPIMNHPGLLSTYADRIIAARDTSRLAPAPVRDAIAAALGDCTDRFWPDYPHAANGDAT